MGSRMNILKFIIINVIFFYLLYLGYVQEIGGVRNVCLFIVWIVIVCGLLGFFYTEELKRELKNKKRKVPSGISQILDFVISLIFVWHGDIATGVLYFLATLIIGGIWDCALKENEQNLQEN
jgi:amino acid transporter